MSAGRKRAREAEWSDIADHDEVQYDHIDEVEQAEQRKSRDRRQRLHSTGQFAPEEVPAEDDEPHVTATASQANDSGIEERAAQELRARQAHSVLEAVQVLQHEIRRHIEEGRMDIATFLQARYERQMKSNTSFMARIAIGAAMAVRDRSKCTDG
jgi:hypothetical protein